MFGDAVKIKKTILSIVIRRFLAKWHENKVWPRNIKHSNVKM